MEVPGRRKRAASPLRVVADGHGDGEPVSSPPRGNLPIEVTSFVGRTQELAEAEDLLRRTRLLTFVGAGGSGKTRLALRVAGYLGASFANGAWWVDLAPLSDPDLVPQRVASALGLPEAPGRPVTEMLVEHLRSREVLLVLDNCEHLVDACARLADEVMRTCPSLWLLATSREPLGVSGEVSWPVPPLSLPVPGSGAPDGSGAVRLFVERARAASPAFTLTEENAADVADLCARLDGMPLAIELAASRVRTLSPGQILQRLDDRFRLLRGGRVALPRHRTLRATMDWSHALLSEGDKVLFSRLSVFSGGFTLEAAERVCAGGVIEEREVLELLSRLVDRSLVVVTHDGGRARYRMLETVRQYAAGTLEGSDERGAILDRHAGFFLACAEEAEPWLMGPDQGACLARLEAEHDNLAAALSWFLGRGEASRGLRMAGALGRFWWFGGHFDEGRGFLQGFLGLPQSGERTAVRAKALQALGLATFWHETEAAGVEISRGRFEEAVGIYRELGDERRLAGALKDLGGYWKGKGDAKMSRSVLNESLALAREAGDDFAIGAAKGYLGVVAAYEGRHEEARSHLEEALAFLHGRGGPDEITRCMFFLACLECDVGDPEAARNRLRELMAHDPLAALPYSAGFAMDGFARLAAAEGDAVRALRLAGAAAAMHERVGTSAGPAYDAYVRRGLEPARRALDQGRSEAAFAEGRAWSLEDAVSRAMQRASPPTRDPSGILSSREAEVLSLVAEGLPDARIAGRLYLSRRTVGNHLHSAYRKLGVKSRTAAVKRAGELGLI